MEPFMLFCLKKVYKFLFICEKVMHLPFESLISAISTFTIVSGEKKKKSHRMVLHRGVL
jgi:hypothetical protein